MNCCSGSDLLSRLLTFLELLDVKPIWPSVDFLKRLIRSLVDKITIAPDTLEVEIQYKVPEAIGACSASGGVFRCYLHRAFSLAGEAVDAAEEGAAWDRALISRSDVQAYP